jgi:hypothetical protein
VQRTKDRGKNNLQKCSYRRQTVVYDARYQGTINFECPLDSFFVTVPQGPRQIAPGFNLGN